MYWKSFWTRNSKHWDHLKAGVGELVKIVLTLFSFSLSRQESIDKKNQHKLIQCLKAFMNNKVRNILKSNASSMTGFCWLEDLCSVLNLRKGRKASISGVR